MESTVFFNGWFGGMFPTIYGNTPRFWNFEPIEGIEDLNPDAVMQAGGRGAALYNSIYVHVHMICIDICNV